MSTESTLVEDGLSAYGRYYSMYRGVVEDNADPEFRARLRVRVQLLHGSVVPNYWAPSFGTPSGDRQGVWMIPQKGDTVMVMFEEGDPSYPMWTYGPWTPNRAPDGTKAASTDPSRITVIQTPYGHRITMDGLTNTMTIESPDHGLTISPAGVVVGKPGDADAQPVVQGTDFAAAMQEFLTDMGTVSGIATPSGPSGPISASPQYASLLIKWSTKWSTLLSKVVRTS